MPTFTSTVHFVDGPLAGESYETFPHGDLESVTVLYPPLGSVYVMNETLGALQIRLENEAKRQRWGEIRFGQAMKAAAAAYKVVQYDRDPKERWWKFRPFTYSFVASFSITCNDTPLSGFHLHRDVHPLDTDS